jgi:ATP-dependent DNA helicase RecG
VLEKIMSIMRLKPTINAKAIGEEIGITSRGVEKNISTLKKLGLIDRIGSKKSGHWIVKI